MATIISRQVKVLVYTSEGVVIRSNRRLGERRHHEELEPVDVAKEKERKRLAAQAARNRAYADKFKEW